MNQSKALITVLLALLLLGGGFYMWKMKTTKPEVLPVTTETSIDNPDDQQDDISARYPQHIVPIEGTDEVWYQIPELEIQMRMNGRFASDLLYEFGHYKDNSYGGAIYLALKSEMKDEIMSISEGDKSLVAISKILGQVKDDKSAYIQSRLHSTWCKTCKYQFKQFENFYLFFQYPIDNGNACSSIINGEDRIKSPNDLCVIFQTTSEL